MMASNKCDRVNRCKNSWWCAVDYNPANKDCFEAMTHFDQIKAMTAEELARFMVRKSPCPDGYTSIFGPHCVEENGCERCWLEWLRQEVKDK